MELHHLIVHELIKAPEENEARLFLSLACMPPEERAHQLIHKLNQTFEQKSDTLLGYFSSPGDALFPGYFQILHDSGYTKEGFQQFSRETMQALQLSLQGVTGAKGGYLVYADYTIEEDRQLGIFLVRDTEGILFDKDDAHRSFGLKTITYLNTDKLAMAGRINIAKFQSGQARCLELIKHASSQRTISEYFTNWIGLDRPESSRDLTQSFLSMVEQLPPPVDEETGAPMEAAVFQDQVREYAMSAPQHTISIKEFDQTFYKDEPKAQSFIQEQALPLEDDFRFDQGTLKRHFQHRISANGMSLQFSRRDLAEGRVSLEGDQIVINDPEMAEKLRLTIND